MGLFSHKRRNVEVLPEQKWDFISLNDFKATSCWTPFAYAIIWVSLFISISVYAVDVFTAYQLLAFNKWSSQVEPAQIIPFDVAKWVFTGCIIMSIVNLIYEWIRAFNIMRRGSVAESFLDHLATRIQCLRIGGQGFKRFLVFAELTKSKKGAEYIALFTFFSFQSWIRVLLCSGPRQVINGFTLYSIFRVKLEIQGDNFDSSLASFIEKIKALATEETRQAVILCGMLYTVVVWIFSFLSILLAAFFFVFFLWGYIPRADGGLTGFCERKVNKRLKEIVADKINKALEDDERKRRRAEAKAAKKTGENRPITLKPSLPVLKDDDLPPMPIKRADTFMSISEKTDVSTGSYEMNQLGGKRPMPSRTGTSKTGISQYSSRQSLIGGAAEMGVTRSESPAPTLPEMGGYPLSRTTTGASNMSYGPPRSQSPAPTLPRTNTGGFPAPSRAPTGASTRPYGPGSQMQRMPSNGSALGGPQMQRMPSNGSALGGPQMPRPGFNGPAIDRTYTASPAIDRTYTASPAIYSSEAGPAGAPLSRVPTNGSSYRGPAKNQPSNRWQSQDDGRQPTLPAFEPTLPNLEPTLPNLDSNLPQLAPSLPNLPALSNFDLDFQSGRASPAPSTTAYGSMSPPRTGPNRYPMRSATNPVPTRGPGPYPPQRNMTAPIQQASYHQRTDSNSSGRSRSNSPGPFGNQQQRPIRHQQTPSNSSLRNMVSSYGQIQSAEDEYDYQPAAAATRSNTLPVNAREDYDDGYGQGGYPAPLRSNTMPVTSGVGRSTTPAARGGGDQFAIQEEGEYDYPLPPLAPPARSNTTVPVYSQQQQDDGYLPQPQLQQPARSNTMPFNNTGGPSSSPSRQNYNGWSDDLERGNGAGSNRRY
ncbi:hypothetical protein QBC38DRAFT_6078 [Podospora fimiseda]|uniref:Pheromone-regulated membrane protein n=1 Tax=Podospora fimiseda TaxID=252190 RepID=A0AAN7C120_9PEZI|nr:hypothetical protein QBC38DRAFT_6078 [Podospora fimiseda]